MRIEPKQQRRLRVLLITARADHGGGPRHILDLLKSFRCGDNPSQIEFYICAPEQEPYASQFRELSNGFLEIPPRRFSIFAFFRLLRFVRNSKIDAIHSHGRGAGMFSRLLGAITGVRVLHTFHGIHREASLMGRIKLLIDQWLAHLPFTPIFVSVNEEREAFEFKCVRPAARGVVIENAVDTSRFGKRNRSAMSDHQKSIRFGSFLRADKAKSPDLFLSLANELRSEGTWSCAGISREELKAEGELPPHLEVMGRIREPAGWLESLDIFLSCSRNEGLPIGVLEAMAANCICLLSDISAHRHFGEKNAALMFHAEDPGSALELIRRIKDNPEVGRTVVANANRLIFERHTLSAFRAKLEAIYAI
ncbi:N/A [soil metagenome]